MGKLKGNGVIITGHSLGGGMANYMAAELKLPTVSFSPVGMTYSAAWTVPQEGLQDALRLHSLSVIPDKDIVPRLGPLQSLRQPIDCTFEGILGWVQCHSIYRTACQLSESCLDIKP